MTKVVKFPPRGEISKPKIGEAHRGESSRQAFPNKNCAAETGNAPNVADPPRKEKSRERLSLKLTAEYWLHVKSDGTEIQFDKEPMPRGANPPIPNIRVWVVGRCAREYTVTFNRSERCQGCIDGRRLGEFMPGKHRNNCTGWTSVPVKPPGEGWIRSNYVHEEIRPLLKADPSSTLWGREARRTDEVRS
jgi:hypothetical protein